MEEEHVTLPFILIAIIIIFILIFLNPPWLVWLNWLGVVPQSERSLVQFLVKAHAWLRILAQLGRRWKATDQCFSLTSMFLSPFLSPSLPLSLKLILKIFLKDWLTQALQRENVYFWCEQELYLLNSQKYKLKWKKNVGVLEEFQSREPYNFPHFSEQS